MKMIFLFFYFRKEYISKQFYNYMTRYIFNNDNDYLTTDNEKISINLSYHNNNFNNIYNVQSSTYNKSKYVFEIEWVIDQKKTYYFNAVFWCSTHACLTWVPNLLYAFLMFAFIRLPFVHVLQFNIRHSIINR